MCHARSTASLLVVMLAGSRAFVAVHTARRALSARAAEATASEQTSEIAASLERVRAELARMAAASAVEARGEGGTEEAPLS